jgi:hypothetical protein
MPREAIAFRKASAMYSAVVAGGEAEAPSAQIGQPESGQDGRASLRAPVRRGSIRLDLAGAAKRQVGVDSRTRLQELRRGYVVTLAEIVAAEREALARRPAGGGGAPPPRGAGGPGAHMVVEAWRCSPAHDRPSK